ncbi:glycosyltransferase [Neorhodopirellula pilleata]|uniref:MurG-like transferase n=1 Tax=Neorhodopirellula pilleata TaxID=2714738 RepID=A0A5C6A2Z4_9BACT|nr:nucleotide disphospho-sugar-binding domain-containing protein [Neorhodopirellula pilleata]TWT93628.1 MurG-like transferase [Neorhodopirellula pilleata]
MTTTDRPIAILSACGSRGDVNPIAAIARELVELGYECHVSVAEPYADVVSAAGAIPNVVIDRKSFDAIVSQSSFWKPLAGGRRVLTEVVQGFFQPHLDFIERHYVPGRTTLVAHPLDFASRVFREIHPDCPLTSIHLAPAMMRHPEFPPRLLPDRVWTRWVLPSGWPRWNRATYWLGDYCFLDRILGPTVNRARRKLGGLPKQRRLMNHWWHSPDQVLAMYPAWFAPEIASQYASERFHFVGFPLDDGIAGESADQSFEPPVSENRPLLVTTGSAHHGDAEFVRRVAQICQRRNVPVVSCCPSNPRLNVGTNNLHSVGYIPLGRWLPHCRGLIHHGGVGTTSRAIDAGIPQMIRPLAFDQFDHAQRIERFCLGIWLRNDRELESAVSRLLEYEVKPSDRPVASANRVAAEMIHRL